VNGIVISAFPAGTAEPPGHAVIAVGVAEVPLAAVPALRRALGPPGQPPFPATFLKAAEDQTVVALAAVARAVEEGNLVGEPFTAWGAIAAPRSLGRLAAAEALYKYEQGGAWKISPFLVPHHSLHSISGTVSQAFRIFGPNFGVGGHAGAVAEGLLASLALLDECRVPGMWLVLSECDPEPIPDRAGSAVGPVLCRALALALRPAAAGREGLRLRLVWRASTDPELAGEAPTVAELVRFITGAEPAVPGRWTCALRWGACVELTRSVVGVRTPARHVA
jgi:hypothetical protein